MKIAIFEVPRRTLRSQVGVMLGSCWPLKSILRHHTIILSAKVEKRGGDSLLGGSRWGPGGPLGRGI